MSATLNKSRSYGEIWGDPDHKGARFVQDGRYFDHEGKQIDYDDKGASVVAKQPVVETVVRDDAAVAIAQRRSELMLKAMPLLETGQDKLIPDLPDIEDELLGVMGEVEAVAKKRQLVIAAIAAELKARADKAATSNGSQVSSQLQ